MRSEKIVIDARMINSSGIGRYLESLLPQIIKTFPNTVLLGREVELKEKVQENVKIIPFYDPIYSIKEQFSYLKDIQTCDLFFSPHYNIPLLPIRAKNRVVTIHDVFHLAFSEELSFSQKIYSKFVINRALDISNRVITVSEFSKNEIIKYTGSKYKEKINVIYNGVSSSFEDYTVSSNPYEGIEYFLFVGNVKPHKNLRRAIEAFKLFLLREQNRIDVVFIIVGKKDGFIVGEDNILSFIEDDDVLRSKVKFTGWINDEKLKNLYSNAISLVFPSLYEGFGLPPLEAMSHNCPVIVSNAACLPEICGSSSVLFFDPFSINDISNKMIEIYENTSLREKLKENGKERIKSFSWDSSIEKHIALFENLMK